MATAAPRKLKRETFRMLEIRVQRLCFFLVCLNLVKRLNDSGWPSLQEAEIVLSVVVISSRIYCSVPFYFNIYSPTSVP